MRIKKIIIFYLCLLMFIPLCVTDSYAASQKTFWYDVKPATMGEFNFSSSGKGIATAKLYRVGWFGIKTLVSTTQLSKKKNNFNMKASLQRNTKYSLKVTYTGEKPKIHYGRNYDYYSTSTKQCGYSVSWEPYNGTYQPYSLQNIETKQVIYLTKEDAAVYCLGITESKYLKCLDTSVKLTYLLTKWGINPQSVLGKALVKLGKSKIISVIKEICTTYGGWKLIPKLTSSTSNAIKKASQNFKYGIKVTVTYTNRGGFTNSYAKWDGKFSSIKGMEYCRGKFSKSQKIKGWY